MTEWGWHSFLSLEHVSSLRWTFYSLVGKPKGAVIGADWFVFTAPLSCKFVLKSWHGLAVCQFSMSFWRSRWLWKDTPPNKEVTGTAKKWKVYIYISLFWEGVLCKLVQAFEHKVGCAERHTLTCGQWANLKFHPGMDETAKSCVIQQVEQQQVIHQSSCQQHGLEEFVLEISYCMNMHLCLYVDFSYISLSVMQVTNPKLANAASGNEISSSLPLSLSLWYCF